MKRLAIFLLACGLSAGSSLCAASGHETKGQQSNQANSLTSLSANEFSRLDKAQAKIDFSQLDRDLLVAAIFHETNQRRAEHELAKLEFHPAARKAAALQAEAMAEHQFVGHTNPHDASKKTLTDRGQLAGLNPSFIAENVAMTFGLQYESGEPFYISEENGKRVLSDEPGGSPIPHHSYLSFAKALLDQWMNSPGHRKNILHEAPKFLGCSASHQTNDAGMPVLFSVQVFYSPLR